MLRVAEHDANYFDMALYHNEIYNTPCVQTDDAQWKPALRDVV